MTAYSRLVQNYWLNWLKNVPLSAFPVAPSTIYLGLYTNNPGDQDTGTEVTLTIRPAGRVAFTLGTVTSTQSSTEVRNDAQIVFGLSAGNAGTVTHFGIHNAPTGAGGLLCYGPLTNSLQVFQNVDVSFSPQDLLLSASSVAFTALLKEYFFNWLKGVNVPAPPTDLYVAPYNGDCGNLGTLGVEFTGPLSGSPIRPELTFGPIVDDVNESRVQNDTPITFTLNAQTTQDISHLVVFDVDQGGSPLLRWPNGGSGNIITVRVGGRFIVGQEQLTLAVA